MFQQALTSPPHLPFVAFSDISIKIIQGTQNTPDINNGIPEFLNWIRIQLKVRNVEKRFRSWDCDRARRLQYLLIRHFNAVIIPACVNRHTYNECFEENNHFCDWEQE